MVVPVSNYLTFNDAPPGRIVHALSAVAKRVTEASEPGLPAAVARGIALGREAIATQQRWDVQKAAQKSTKRGEAAALDIELDQLLSAIFAIASGRAVGKADSPLVARAKELLAEAFPQGVGAVTIQPMEEQVADVEGLVAKFEDPKALAPHVAALGLADHVALAKDLTGRLRVELEKPQPGELTWAQVLEAKRQAREAYEVVLAKIIGRYAEPAHSARREALLAEPNRQNRLISELKRRRRPVVDVDPDTGDVVDDASADGVPVAA